MSGGEVRFIQGNTACVEGALAAGARFFAGYPMIPSAEIDILAARLLPALGGIYLQMEDDLASLAAVIGASLSGVKSFTATSSPGFSLMQENLGMAIMVEVPCVLINVQRFGPSNGLATRPAQGDVLQSRFGTHGDHAMIVLSPASAQECFDLTVKAFNLSESLRTPVILLSDEIVGHMREKVIIPDPSDLQILNRKVPHGEVHEYLPYQPGADGIAPLSSFGSPYIFHASSFVHDEKGFPINSPDHAARVSSHLFQKIEGRKEAILMTQEEMIEDARYLLIAYGATYRTAREALYQGRKEGYPLGLLKLTTIWPFPEERIRLLGEKVEKVFVPEMNRGQIKGEVMKYIDYRKVVGINKVNGELITPLEILEKVKEEVKNE